MDNIILKALRKEPERRYSSVEQFSEDIRRHLVGLPVAASADTWTYRASKFIARNRAAAAFAALVFIALVGGTTATAWQASRAENERARAERRLDNLRRVSTSLVEEVHVAIRDLPGSLPARELLTTRAVEQLDALASDAGDNPALFADLGIAYQHLSSLPHKSLAERRQVLEKALAMYQKILDGDPTNNKARTQTAQCLMPLADFARAENDLPTALEYNRRAIALVEAAIESEPDNQYYKVFYWNTNYNYAQTLYQTGDARASAERARGILPVAEELRRIGQIGTEKYNFMRPHLTRASLAKDLIFLGEYETAAEELRLAIHDCEAELAARPNEMVLVRNLGTAQRNAAVAAQASNDPEAALRFVNSSLDNFDKLLAAHPKSLDYQSFQAATYLAAGQIFAARNQPAKAAAHFRRALELNEAVAAADAQRVQARADAAQANAQLGNALFQTGEREEGARRLREAIRFYESANHAATVNAPLKHQAAEAYARLAAALAAENKTPESLAEALEFYRKSLDLWRDLQQRGALKHADASQPEEIARRLAELDAAQSN